MSNCWPDEQLDFRPSFFDLPHSISFLIYLLPRQSGATSGLFGTANLYDDFALSDGWSAQFRTRRIRSVPVLLALFEDLE